MEMSSSCIAIIASCQATVMKNSYRKIVDETDTAVQVVVREITTLKSTYLNSESCF